MVAIVDCNNFYCSCERAFDPSLKGKPIIVLSNNDGCAISRSDEAKALGIKMGSPSFMISDLILKHNVKVFSSNYALYGDMSKRVMANLAAFAPTIEMYSIDEAFLDLSELKNSNLQKLSGTIRKAVIQNTGIPVSIGVAPTKTLAKIANRLCKKTVSNNGIYVIENDAQRLEALKLTDIADVWGIGSQHSKKLQLRDVRTAFDFSMLPDDFVRKEMSVIGLRTLHELRGIPSIEWVLETPPKKGICTSRSFGKLTNDLKIISEAVANFAANCAAKLREQKSCCKAIHLFIKTNTNRLDLKQCFRSIDLNLPVATNSSSAIVKEALHALNIIYAEGYYFMKAGVIVNDIVPENVIQGGLFERSDTNKSKLLMQTLDSINGELGKDIVRLSSQGYERKWKLKAEKLSPKYTTNFNELPLIKV